MKIVTIFRLFSSIVLIFCLVACGNVEQTQASNEVQPISREKALEIGKLAATKYGYDLTKYELDTFGEELSTKNDAWMFVFMCKPTPAPLDCHFMVVVNRQSGVSEVFPGE
jgi:hypothetical protein